MPDGPFLDDWERQANYWEKLARDSSQPDVALQCNSACNTETLGRGIGIQNGPYSLVCCAICFVTKQVVGMLIVETINRRSASVMSLA
jgi:hypothetical protein